MLIAKLFAEGKSFFSYPFKITFLNVSRSEAPPVQVLIAVSKRNFKSAVERNRIKRLVREAYRKNKHIVWDSFNDRPHDQLLISMVYTGKTIVPHSGMERKIILILHRLKGKHEGTDR